MDAGRLLAENRRRLAAFTAPMLGRPWEGLRAEARRSALAAASDYLLAGGEPVPAAPTGPVLMAGHQPELFHPGVWVKNFALHGLAAAHGAASVNLVVDNATAKATVLHLPEVGPDTSRLASLPFDAWTEEIPYEERAVRDEALFASLPDRAAALTTNWGFVPVLPAFWGSVLAQAGRTRLLGERFAAGRRGLERQWGCHNLEVPVSLLCQTEPFAWFACHLLAELPRFHATYNDCVHEYRRVYGLKSRNHPVPDLASEDGWLEVPFWAWRPERPRRGRLMARAGDQGIELRAGGEAWPTLPRPEGGGARRAICAWLELERRGFKVRSRALTNTLYARLFVCDLFVHGIGGGKYDELTDEIARRFYGAEPPGFMVLSATLLLPLPGYAGGEAQCRRLAHELRDLHWNPQRHLDGASAGELVARKRAWIDRRPAGRRGRRERFVELRRLTEQLRPFVADRERRLAEELDRCEHQLQANAVIHRRDYAFCLYPARTMRDFCRRFGARPGMPCQNDHDR